MSFLKNLKSKVAAPGPNEAQASGLDKAAQFENMAQGNEAAAEEDIHRELKFLKKLHKWDPNIERHDLEGIERADETRDVEKELEMVNIFENDSPYAEVRAAVRNYDEEDLPVNTIRMWTIGFIVVTLGCAMNMLFSMRNPSIVITNFVAQLVAFPFGLAWDFVMPKSLVPGKFNMKEHAMITIMANVAYSGSGGVAYSTDTIIAMKGFYGVDFGWAFNILLTISMQAVGYGLAGIMRRFLVWPASMLWPSNFVNTSLFYALHDRKRHDPAEANGWKISRFRYFGWVFLGSFVWYFFPGWIWQGLSYFDFATWIAPENVVVNQLFGYNSGLGLIPITFDWTQVTGYGILSPIMYPWHGIANTTIGVVLFFTITSIGLHYTNYAWQLYLPMSTSGSFDNTGASYNVSRILTSDYTLDLAKYKKYSPLFLSTTFTLTYGLSFATIMALITHTALFHGEEIMTRARLAFGDEPDVHTRMMAKYKEVPDWWYLLFGTLMFGLSMLVCVYWDTGLPWWGLIIAFFIAMVFMIPIGMIQAITNLQLGLNVITEFIIGFMVPGRPIGMMLFKSYGYITMVQALYFCQNLKLGHYVKVPPRVMFVGQILATFWSAIVQIAVMYWAFGSIEDVCDIDQKDRYSCPGGRVFFTASIIWGLIGPQRIFAAGQIYNGMLWFFLVGAVTPPIFYVLARKFPKSPIRYINVPLIFGGSGLIPPAQVVNYTSWAFYGWIFNKLLRNKYRGWWSHYNYLTSAGLDTGLAICTILIFLTLQLTNQEAPNWWGNTVFANTLDWNYTAVNLPVPDKGYFGPDTW